MAYFIVANEAALPEPRDVPVGCYVRAKDTGQFYRNQSLGRGWIKDRPPIGYLCRTCGGAGERPSADLTTTEPCPRCRGRKDP